MDLVEHALVVGVAVDRGHEAALDPDGVVQHFRDRGEAIGRAAGVGDDQVLGGQRVLVDAEHDGLGNTGRRGRDQHPLGACFEVRPARLVGLEEAGAFEHQLDAQLLVRQLARVALLGDDDVAAVDLDRIAVRSDRAGEAAMGRIIGEQQRVRLGIGEIVDRDELEIVILALENHPRDQPPDAPEPVDRYLRRHFKNSC